MVREIINLQIGQCGNQLGHAFWKIISAEHYLSENGNRSMLKSDDIISDEKLIQNQSNEFIQTYFRETDSNQYRARSILVDNDPGTLDNLKSSPYHKLYNANNFVFGHAPNRHNFKVAPYDEAELIDEVMECIRREYEFADNPQGLQLIHAISGNKAGSMMGGLLLMKFRDHYPDKLSVTHSVFPSAKVSDSVVDAYQSTLCILQLIENSDISFVFDNEALYNIVHCHLGQEVPRYSDLNWIASMAMSGITG